ncbi:F-box domain-containing protein [Caenorhabditis elegans]|nr:F-box domain-containing protein [Caenorhabditis elegans]CUV67063.1 F-box domain-containing protein [Caenorhabditis elegans]|eukprot:NP_001305210.1 Uncharacterized protein CELE_C32B5.15 [Caenorhabditis elegans]
MPFNLFTFPLVIRRQIPQEMSFIDVLNFSFCSSKTETLARKSIKKGYSSMIHSCSNLSVERSYVMQMKDINNLSEHLSFLIREASREDIIQQEKWFKLKIGQTMVYCATPCHEASSIIKFYFNGSTLKVVHEMLRNTILNLHQTHLKSNIIFFWKQGMSQQKIHHFSNIRNVNHIILSEMVKLDTIPITFLDQIFSTWPNLGSLSLYPQIDGELKDECGLFSIKRLFLGSSCLMADSVIPRFKGRHLSAKNAFISSEQVMHWLHQWTTDINFQNIQTMTFSLAPGYQLNVENIYQEVNAKPWDPATRPIDYCNEETLEKIINCEEWLDISSNGRLISILVKPKSFGLVQWQL